MKYLHFVFLLISFSFLSACGSQQSSQEGAADVMPDHTVDRTGPEYTSAYVCPMHCKGSGSDVAGKCPACGMDYVLNEKTTTEMQESNTPESDTEEEKNHHEH
ncbi:MAG: heavy metal-binding domain-containing protein [Chitinophagales bacterium]|nr:hypothetical protein [Bacteroidota bacterium]MCB9042427.1 hypothetical protein [Chitinophagales bacterium]